MNRQAAALVFCSLASILISMNSLIAAPEQVKVGVIIGMSGTLSQYGEWGRQGISVAADEWGDSEAARGRVIQLLFEDHAGHPSRAASAYASLRQRGAKYFITSTSSVALAIAPLVRRDGLVQIDISSTSPKYSVPNDCTFRTSFLATDLAKEAARLLVGRFSVTFLALLTADSEYGEGIHDSLYHELGDRIVARERFGSSSVDLRPELAHIKQRNPDALWITGFLREAALAVRQARSLGFRGQFFADAVSVEAKDFLESAGNAADGLIYFSPRFNAESTAPSLMRRFAVRGGDRPNYYVAQSYDAVRALVTSFSECKSSDVMCVCKWLQRSAFAGASGATRFDVNGDVRRVIEAKTIKDGKFEKMFSTRGELDQSLGIVP